jgi:hypothetical protein
VPLRIQIVERECRALLREKCSVERLWSLLGKIEWLARTMPFSRCWKRTMLMELRFRMDLAKREVRQPGLGFRVSGSALGGSLDCGSDWKLMEFDLTMGSRRELKWWINHAGDWTNARLEDVGLRARDIHCDASGFAFGNTDGLWGLWKAEERNWHIMVKEMEALRRTVCMSKHGSKLSIKCDNQAVYWSLKRGRSFCWDLNDLVRRIGGDVFARKIDLNVEWIGTKSNLADGISRAWSRREGLQSLRSIGC